MTTLRLYILSFLFFLLILQIIIDELVSPVGCSREPIHKKIVVKVTIEAKSDDRGHGVMDLNNDMLLLPVQDIYFRDSNKSILNCDDSKTLHIVMFLFFFFLFFLFISSYNY